MIFRNGGLGFRHVSSAVVITLSFLVSMSLAASLLPAAGAASHDVEMKNLAFSPSSITIAPGDTVTWTNNDGVTHTVTGNDGLWESGNLASGQTYTHQFNTTGDFAYHCSIHLSMTGVVHVSNGTSPGTTPGSPSHGLSTTTIALIAAVIAVVVIVAGVVLWRRKSGPTSK